MNTDVIEPTDVRDEPDTGTGQEPADPIEAFIAAATLPPRQLPSKEEIEALRNAAVEALEERYGSFDPQTETKQIAPEIAAAIEHPVHRFIVLGTLSGAAWTKHRTMDKLRADRRTAIQNLKFNYGWKPIAIIRKMGADERRIIDFAIMNADRTTLPRWTEKRAAEVAESAHQQYVRCSEYGEVARPLRDALLHELAEGRWEKKRVRWHRLTDAEMTGRREAEKPVGRIYSNAELARLGTLSTAMVALIRTGATPSARRAAAA